MNCLTVTTTLLKKVMKQLQLYHKNRSSVGFSMGFIEEETETTEGRHEDAQHHPGHTLHLRARRLRGGHQAHVQAPGGGWKE